MLVDIIAGARPNFMKIAPIIREIRNQGGLNFRLVHTGQHYDFEMSRSFFVQLEIPNPHVNLEVGSGSQADQTASIMIRYESLLDKEPADLCLVVGDVNSTMACAIVAKKKGLTVAHVEGGLRSSDWSMPEEVNRVVTDSLSDYFFTTSRFANENLRAEGVSDERIFFVGNTMIDTLVHNLDKLKPPSFLEDTDLRNGEYFVLTLHRPANVDQKDSLADLLNSISAGAGELAVVFPVHPRTRKTLNQLELPSNIITCSSLGYHEFIYLIKNSRGVITDSGGITEEATYLGTPCLTIRDTTERPETVDEGTNELVGSNAKKLKHNLTRIAEGRWKEGAVPERWDGKTGERIVRILKEILNS